MNFSVLFFFSSPVLPLSISFIHFLVHSCRIHLFVVRLVASYSMQVQIFYSILGKSYPLCGSQHAFYVFYIKEYTEYTVCIIFAS